VIRILVPALVLCVAALPATAQTVQRRHVLRAAFQGDEPELDDEDQDTEQAVPDQPEDDGSEELHAFPRRRAVPSLPSSPEDEDEQPSAPPEQHLPADGLVEPASAMQPLSPE
jgi:hypothetical protein